MFLRRLCNYGSIHRNLKRNLLYGSFRTLTSGKNFYKILDVDENATQDEIRQAFLKKAKELHPDANRHDAKTHELFIELNDAYDALSTLSSRRMYDRMLKRNREFGENNSWNRHRRQPPQTPGAQHDSEYEYSHETYYQTAPPKWTEEFTRPAHFEEDYEHLSFWQRHWSGILIFIAIQVHVCLAYYHAADTMERHFIDTWFYDNMDEEEFEIYINTKSHRYDHIGDLFNPETRKEMEERQALIEKIKPPVQRYQLTYLKENYKPLKVPLGWKPSVSANSEPDNAAIKTNVTEPKHIKPEASAN